MAICNSGLANPFCGKELAAAGLLSEWLPAVVKCLDGKALRNMRALHVFCMVFIADIMLQKLARWLRMFGIPIKLPQSRDDDEIIREAAESELTLLTRDKLMYRKARDYCRVYLVKSSKLHEQILEVNSAFKLHLDSLSISSIPSNVICASCNGKLVSAAKESVRAEVPPKSYARYGDYFRCVDCNKVYWKGSHNKKILEEFMAIRKELKANKPPVA